MVCPSSALQIGCSTALQLSEVTSDLGKMKGRSDGERWRWTRTRVVPRRRRILLGGKSVTIYGDVLPASSVEAVAMMRTL